MRSQPVPAIALLLLAFPLSLPAQRTQKAPEPPTIVFDAQSQEWKKAEPYDNPELFGTERAPESSTGPLPRLVAEYAIRSGAIVQRIAIFDNGIAAVERRGSGTDVKRRIQLPEDLVNLYRDLTARIETSSLSLTDGFGTLESQETIRFHKGQKLIEIRHGAPRVLPHQLDQLRLMLTDLLNAVADDRQVTNPVNGYVPAIGDRLTSDEGQRFEVVRVVNDGTMVELKGLDRPFRMYVSTDSLYQLFIDVEKKE